MPPASPASRAQQTPAWPPRLARPWRQSQAWLRHNLHARAALGVGLPILLALSLLSLVHYWRERHLLADQARLTALQVGQVILGSLRHSMMDNDPAMVRAVLGDISQRQTIERAQIVDLSGGVLIDSGAARPGIVQHVAEPGCTACHRLSAGARPEAVVVSTDVDLMRVAAPIDSGPECAGCHPADAGHLGILLIDVPMRILWPHAVQNLQLGLTISAGLTVVLAGGLYWLLHHLVVRRVEAFRAPLADYAAGHFDVRLPALTPVDEIGELALAFNRMADRLEQHARDELARSELRQHAIVEERERIARELHDGLAQVLGYVNTKATAVRLLLKRQQVGAAETQLAQLEEAARNLSVDVREAILGLKLTSRRDARLAALLRDYAEHFSQLCDLPVDVNIAPGAAEAALPAEAELQLLRIVQEALANVRKHARANRATISLSNGGPSLVLSICDDGRGFDSDNARASQRPHFGLGTMRERAEAIGADFAIASRQPHGTTVTVRLPLTEGDDARAGG